MQSADLQALAQQKARLEHLEALRSLQGLQAASPPPQAPAEGPKGPQRPWRWDCDKCSDASCEHRLFSQLMTARPSAEKGPQGNS